MLAGPRPTVVAATMAVVGVTALALAQLVAVVAGPAGDGPGGSGGVGIGRGVARDVDVYAGQGAWVDVYDFVPHALATSTSEVRAAVDLDDLDAMAAAGVRTLYLQAAFDDGGEPDVVDHEAVGAFLAGAHERGLRVVGWYLPRFTDVDRDLAHLRAVADFEADGHRFDGLAVDIEWTDGVTDPDERSARLVELSRRLARDAAAHALGAIVLPPVQTDVVNPGLWPDFPWRDLAGYYDVWLPMGYWTERRADSGYRNSAAYTGQNVERLRRHLGDPEADVHPIGGIADDTTAADLAGFVAELGATGAIGGSVYDWATLDGPKRRQIAAAFPLP
ncbi:MAG TPA: hypothetical protein VE623_17755 [Acidimicrobiales bacterium]|nr:hypothetical protein [Acidimicrobiales bacterium]